MRTLAILFAVVAVSSAATIMTMSDEDFEKAMMGHMAAPFPMPNPMANPMMNGMMDFLAFMDGQSQQQEEPEAVEAEGEEEVAHNDDAEEPAENQKETAAVEDEEPEPQVNMFANGMMAMVFPDMKTGTIHYISSHQNKKPAAAFFNNKHELLANGNGSNGNGNKGSNRGGGSAAAASASSFSNGSNSFSSSQAQAFSGSTK